MSDLGIKPVAWLYDEPDGTKVVSPKRIAIYGEGEPLYAHADVVELFGRVEQLEKERDLMKGIRFANSCVTNQIIAPLEMINQYVDILVSKSQPRPDIQTLLNAIKGCSRII